MVVTSARRHIMAVPLGRGVKVILLFSTVLLVFLTLFTIILPLTLRDWTYSRYFMSTPDQNELLERVSAINMERLKVAELYLKSLNAGFASASLSFYESLSRQSQPLDLVVVIITVDREGNSHPATSNHPQRRPTLGYLTQVVAAFDNELKRVQRQHSMATGMKIAMFVCNAEYPSAAHKLANKMSAFIPVVSRSANEKPAIHRSSSTSDNKYERERSDYVFCLEHAVSHYNTRYILLVQDDAVPNRNFFATLFYLLRVKINKELSWRGRSADSNGGGSGGPRWGLCKLYYPERWLGYSWDVQSITELVGIGIVAGSVAAAFSHVIFRRAFRGRSSAYISASATSNGLLFSTFILTFAFFVSLSWVVGRQYLLEVRKLSRFTHFVSVDAPRCCVPAVLYPRERAGELTKFLRGETCSARYPVDLAIDKFTTQQRPPLAQYLVQPNMLRHIGMYSSLAAQPKPPSEFMW